MRARPNPFLPLLLLAALAIPLAYAERAAANLAPTVAITSPNSGASFAIGSDITITANAADADGSVSKVNFFAGTDALGKDSSPPYSIVWHNVPAGNYALKAVASDNNRADGASALVTITVAAADGTAPSVPTGLTASGQSADSIALAWNASSDDAGGSGIAGYDVYRDGVLAGTTAQPSFIATGLAAATAYSFRVRARDNAGNASLQSASLSASTTAAVCSALPGVPSGLNAKVIAATSIGLAWTPSPPRSHCTVRYRVFRDGVRIATTSATSYTAGALSPDNAYTFAVSAVNEFGSSARSAPIGVRTASAPGGRRVVGYFAQWGVYDRNYLVRNIDTSGAAIQLSHLHYAFGNVRNNRCEVGVVQATDKSTGAGGDAYADYSMVFSAGQSVDGIADNPNQPLRGNWNQLRKLKAKYPGLRVLMSLGGWTWSRGFASAARPANRVAFVASCIDAYIRGNLPLFDSAGGAGAAAGVFDGIDIDWEYPAACGLSCGNAEDTDNYTALLAEFRRQLDAVRPGLLLTAAVGAGIDKIRVTRPDLYHPYLDYLNVMTYDFHGDWESRTNFHSALFDSPNDPAQGDARFYNSNDAIQAFLDRGVPAAKLNLGICYYGRGWTNVPIANNGLYQSGDVAPGTDDPGVVDYRLLKDLRYAAYDDPLAHAHWIYNGKTFWTFDDPALVAEKMAYVKAQNLGGAFVWELGGDDDNATLTGVIKSGLR